MHTAVLDVGSNSAHLVIFQVSEEGAPLPLRSWKCPTRLAEAARKDGTIEASGVARVVSAVEEAAQLLQEERPEEMVAFATSAIRDASNAQEIVQRIEA